MTSTPHRRHRPLLHSRCGHRHHTKPPCNPRCRSQTRHRRHSPRHHQPCHHRRLVLALRSRIPQDSCSLLLPSPQLLLKSPRMSLRRPSLSTHPRSSPNRRSSVGRRSFRSRRRHLPTRRNRRRNRTRCRRTRARQRRVDEGIFAPEHCSTVGPQAAEDSADERNPARSTSLRPRGTAPSVSQNESVTTGNTTAAPTYRRSVGVEIGRPRVRDTSPPVVSNAYPSHSGTGSSRPATPAGRAADRTVALVRLHRWHGDSARAPGPRKICPHSHATHRPWRRCRDPRRCQGSARRPCGRRP